MNYSDESIIELLKDSREEAIELLFMIHYDYLCRCVYKLIRDTQYSEDIVQEVFSEVWKKRDRLNIKTSIKGYLRKAAINKTLNYIRTKKYTIDEADESIQINTKEPSSQLMLEGEELQKKINAAIEKLPEKCRLVFSMSRFEELSYKEIAAELDISVKTVENQISKALKNLKAELSQYMR